VNSLLESLSNLRQSVSVFVSWKWQIKTSCRSYSFCAIHLDTLSTIQSQFSLEVDGVVANISSHTLRFLTSASEIVN